eukprot:TRINITY_DN4237_c0_g1_i1.p1 TRINITY_DN4237_c0_g1~~TRINITY_DN4237_c0_g1_i1.p1  ORF type:complete len:1340 (+),score=389.41 TRINITY_DN4237_c0_g1_i1:487-4020(+)
MEGGENHYPSPYNLELHFDQVIDTVGYNVIEPGCDIDIRERHLNIGGMPTPSHQYIRAFVADNQWVFCPIENRVPMVTYIHPGNIAPIPKPIRSIITDVHEPAFGNPFHAIGHLNHVALVDRVNQDFANIRKEDTPFTIEFPIHASLIKGGTAVQFGEEAPMVFSLWNKSLLSIGANAAQVPRVLATTLHILPATMGGKSKDLEDLKIGDIRLRDADGREIDDFPVGLQSQILEITPNQTQFFVSTMQFINPDVKNYTRVQVHARLHLGHVKNMMVARNIQTRPFEIQKAEGYSRDEFSDTLIIVNNRTEYDEIVAWRRQLGRIGGNFAVWNVHLYGDLALDHIRKDARTLLHDFQGGTIIFINNLCLRDERLDQPGVSFARTKELFLAARDYGINTLIYGSTNAFVMENELTPAINGACTAAGDGEGIEHMRIAYFKNQKKFLTGLRKWIVPGPAGPIPQPATDPCDLCGPLKIDKIKYWCNLITATKTLCYYKSGNQQFPVGMIYLGIFSLSSSDDGSEFSIKTPQKTYVISSATEKEARTKTKRYSTRNNFVSTDASLVPWHSRIEGLIPQKLAAPKSPVISALVNSNDDVRSSSDSYVTVDSSDNMSANGADVASSSKSSSPSITSGYLLKRGGGPFGSSYTKLWFVIDSTEESLAYYSSKNSSTPVGSFPLTRYALLDLASSKGKHKFEIRTPTDHLILSADSLEEKRQWMSSLRLCVSPSPVSAIAQDSNVSIKNKLIKEKYRISHPQINVPFSIPDEDKHPIETQVVRHNTVIRIPIEERYIVSKPKVNDLSKKAKRLHKDLQKRFPNQRNIVVYNYSVASFKRGIGKKLIGVLDVHRSLDNTSVHFLTVRLQQDDLIHSPDSVNSPSTMYNLLKIQPFVRKLVILNEELTQRPPATKQNCHIAGRTTVLELVMIAILSDIADEQMHFQKTTWRAGLDPNKIPQLLNTIASLINFTFDPLSAHGGVEKRIESVAADVLIELMTHVEILTKAYVTLLDKILPHRRRNDVSKATKKTCRQILYDIICPAELSSSSSTVPNKKEIRQQIKKFQVEKKKAWVEYAATNSVCGYTIEKKKTKKDKKEILEAYYNPPGLAAGLSDPHAKTHGYLSSQDFSAYFGAPRPDNVVEGKFMFKSQEDRYESVGQIQRELGCVPDYEASSRTKVTPNIYPF